MRKENKKLHILPVRILVGCLVSLMVIESICLINPTETLAAEEAMISISGLQIGDQVDLFQIASYDEGAYTWAPIVADWMTNKETGRIYRNLTTAQFSSMTAERAKEFCDILLSNLKNDARAVSNIEKNTIRVEQEDGAIRTDLDPGYYIIIPTGTDRVYDLKWFIKGPGAQTFVSYETGDYQMPSLSATITNMTKDRGKKFEKSFCLMGDQLKVEATVNLPVYPSSYSTGKRILNTTIVIPKGLDYVDDSLEIPLEKGIEEKTAYSLGEYKGSILYQTQSGENLFFGKGNYYYAMDGSLLVAKGSLEEALETYNTANGTGYLLPKSRNLAITYLGETVKKDTDTESSETGSETNEETNTEVTTDSDDTTGSTEGTESEETDNGLSIVPVKGATIFVVAINTELNLQEVTIRYLVEKNRDGQESGSYQNQIIFNYSISPLNTDLIARKKAEVCCNSYGISLVLCEGTGESISMTAAQKLTKSKRLTSAAFYLYELIHTYDGDVTFETNEAANNEATNNEATDHEATNSEPKGESETTSTSSEEALEYGERIIRIYDKEKNITSEYELKYKIYPDEYGEVSIGGLEEKEYLLLQVLYPNGYTRSIESIVIDQNDWTNESLMNGITELQLIWLDYKPAYIVGTGKIGIIPYAITGGTISGIALVLLADRYLGLGIGIRLYSLLQSIFFQMRRKIRILVKK